MDAPRHFFLHTKKSMELLAKSADLEIAKVEFDSTYQQIIGSERYLKGIALREPYEPPEELVKAANKKAKELNALMDGDQACFYIRHA